MSNRLAPPPTTTLPYILHKEPRCGILTCLAPFLGRSGLRRHRKQQQEKAARRKATTPAALRMKNRPFWLHFQYSDQQVLLCTFCPTVWLLTHLTCGTARRDREQQVGMLYQELRSTATTATAQHK